MKMRGFGLVLPVILVLLSVPAEAQDVPAEARENWICAWPSGDPSPAFTDFTVDGHTLSEDGGGPTAIPTVPMKYTILENNELDLVAVWPYHVVLLWW
jgi:hypothetical protein